MLGRLFQRAVVLRGRAAFCSSSTTPTSSKVKTETAAPAAETTEEDFFLDMSKFVSSIGIDVRSTNQGQSFAKMLRDSKLMQLGDIDGRVVIGRIVHRMQDDLYIDFGLKFNAVCKAHADNSEAYRVGQPVLIRLHDLELSEKFLGSKRDLTLLEADATLIRLVRQYRKGLKGEQPTPPPKAEQSAHA